MDYSTSATAEQNYYLPTILVIEDDEDNRLLLKYALDMFNYKSLIAADAKRGFFLAQTYQPDIILLDIVLAKISGLKLASLLKSCQEIKHIRIIALTALAKRKEIRRIFNSGCDSYLCKPYLLDDLKLAIETQLNIARSSDKAQMFYRSNKNLKPVRINIE